jgi:hypothetical protein
LKIGSLVVSTSAQKFPGIGFLINGRCAGLLPNLDGT